MHNKIKNLFYDGITYSHTNENFPEETNFYKHFHNTFEMLYIKNISPSTFIVEGQKYNVKNDTLLIIRPSNYHYLSFNRGCHYDRIIINFENSVYSKSITDYFQSATCINVKSNKILYNMFDKLIQYEEIFEQEEFMVICKNIIEEILRLIVRLPQIQNENSAIDHVTLSAIGYIEENIDKVISLDSIADALFISKSTLYHKFKKSMKITIMKYIRDKKISIAQNMIKQGIKPTKVYEMVGFEDYTTFYRAYLNITKKKPSDKS